MENKNAGDFIATILYGLVMLLLLPVAILLDLAKKA